MKGWVVAKRYDITNGVLCWDPRTGIEKGYNPFDFPQVATDLARLSERDEKAMLEFARKWGSIGYLDLVKADAQLLEEEQERLLGIGGDPLAWIGAHAHGVHICLSLLNHLARYSEERLSQYLQSIYSVPKDFPKPAQYPGHSFIRELILGIGYRVIPFDFDFPFDEDPRHQALGILGAVMDLNMQRITMRLEPISDIETHSYRYTMGWDFVALIDVVYWHLAQLILGKIGLARCEECRGFFLQYDKRQRFCGPTCQKKHGMRRLRAKAKVKREKAND